MGHEPGIQMLCCAPVGRLCNISTEYAAFHGGFEGFNILFVGPDVSNMGESKGNNLSRIRRIGQNFLITSQRRVETHLACGVVRGQA